MSAVRTCFAVVILSALAGVAGAQDAAFAAATGARPPMAGMSTQLTRPGQDAATPAPTAAPAPSSEAHNREIDESVYGATLFRGHFAQQSYRGFNPDYLVSVGDVIDLKLWGAFDLVVRLEVDSHGNIFVPKVGPVSVSNTRNASLNEVVTEQVKRVFRDSVGVYASLANAEPVKVFVTGNVNAPGLYGAWASDSILHFLDRAGGIDTRTGSFLDIAVRRGDQIVLNVNLYDFLIRGALPLMQFRDGDTIVVGSRKSTATVSGLVKHPAQFEFERSTSLRELLQLAAPDGTATHVRVVKNQGAAREASYYALTDGIDEVVINSGDEVIVSADRPVGSIIASVEGEYQGVGQYVFPYESTLDDLLKQVKLTSLSNASGVRLYRRSLAARQKEVLEEMLRRLEQAALTARSGTLEESELRVREAELVLKFVDRARQIEPLGRLVMHEGFDPKSVSLEDRDVIEIPRKSNIVAVQGEVFFPNSFVYQEGKSVGYYVQQAGGVTQNGGGSRIFLVRPSGEMIDTSGGWLTSARVMPGDEIMVLPKVDSKNFQFSKEIVQVIYQLALSAGVVLRL